MTVKLVLYGSWEKLAYMGHRPQLIVLHYEGRYHCAQKHKSVEFIRLRICQGEEGVGGQRLCMVYAKSRVALRCRSRVVVEWPLVDTTGRSELTFARNYDDARQKTYLWRYFLKTLETVVKRLNFNMSQTGFWCLFLKKRRKWNLFSAHNWVDSAS